MVMSKAGKVDDVGEYERLWRGMPPNEVVYAVMAQSISCWGIRKESRKSRNPTNLPTMAVGGRGNGPKWVGQDYYIVP